MYTPREFKEERVDVLYAFMRAQSLAAVVSSGPDGLAATHIPLLLDAREDAPVVLRGHMARANPQWRALANAAEVLTIFAGPHHYISPSWYQTKQETGKVVPTWNYAVVHAYGTACVHEDREWLLAHLNELTDFHEQGFAEPWSVADAPADYVDNMTRAIVGIEIEVRRLEGKWKMSQNRPEADREGILEGLNALRDDSAAMVAKIVERWNRR